MRRTASLVVPLLLVPLAAHAQTGVSDDRVSLPSGPGSADGAGDNAVLGSNHGSFRHVVAIETPAGPRGSGPTLSLEYDSGGGAGLVGLGWRLVIPSIERSAMRGLPAYTIDDDVVAGAAETLVPVADAGRDRTYRARFEGAFVRYTWHDAGAAGHWRAEAPDGTVSWFGASADGVTDPTARLDGPAGETFRWNLVESRDPFGHAVRYEYEGASPRIRRIRWGFDASGAALFDVAFGYEARSDVLSDCTPGFEERVEHRLASIEVRARGRTVRRYVLGYEPDASSGGRSRLASIETFGSDGARHAALPRFRYS
ncbi:hypothetical protein L6R52_02455, partial [Myxococcota bacterium]|nr:hypothetical protein [Myxococcota bacterium]